ncbi:MAG: sigma-70 family RNA polymerase sigma factor [Chloroflexia bacterium]|nr:sigma-70 family RNA polymerase sigma factor [Chloroflexia bacterium]
MIDFALYIGMKNELLVKVKDEIKKLIRRNKENQELRPIVHQLNNSLRHNTELVEFTENVEKVNIDFINKLTEKYPDITENEKQLAIFLRLNFSSKEIADFRAVSIKAVEMSRYRLRKKFELDKNDSLRQFIQSL